MGTLTDEKTARLEKGLFLTGCTKPTAPAKISVSGTIMITEGRKHQVRRMLKSVGCLILYLKRTSMGDITLDSELAPGEWKEI